ncbi:hypothetical protein C0989_007664 [Termitomyces sp. Mn162]|nr:hypothetical protein C0989_007664 [Termitomyces sp. Mn162]
MSSISFPSEQPVPSNHEQSFYSSPFEGNASFQMNPLSSHPPRTHRGSAVSSSSAVHVYDTQNIYGTEEKTVTIENEKEETDEVDVEEEQVSKPALVHISREEVWRDLFLTSNGRDKGFVCFDLVDCPLTEIKAQQSVPYSTEVSAEKSRKIPRPFLHTLLYAPPPVLLELVNALADDAATLSLLGLFGKKFGDRADRFSDWCWFISTLVGLVENGVERQMLGNLQHDVETRLYSESMTGATSKSRPKSTKTDEKELTRLRKQDYWLQISRAKLVMDLIFVSYELFRIQRFKEPVKTFTGLIAAILSSYKLYHGQYNVLLKKSL